MQGIEVLSMALEANAMQLKNLEDLRPMLDRALQEPSVMDAESLEDMERVYGEMVLEMLPTMKEHAQFWKVQAVTAQQQRDLARFFEQLDELENAGKSVLEAVASIRGNTIDDVMALSDEELARQVLTGKRKLPGQR